MPSVSQSEAPDPRRASWRGHGPVNEAPGCDSLHSHSACVIQVCPHRSWPVLLLSLPMPLVQHFHRGKPVLQMGAGVCRICCHMQGTSQVRGKKRGPVEPQICILTLASVACVIMAGKTYLSL